MGMNADRLRTGLEIAGAALAIPAAIAGAYSAYRAYFSTEVACQALRTSIMSIIDKNIPAEAKRTLLQKDFAAFETRCAKLDPDAFAVFQVAFRETEPARASVQPAAAPAPTTVRRIWVALDRRDAGHVGEINFDGYTAPILPTAGTVLTARWSVPVWGEPQPPGPIDSTKITGRLAFGHCVQVVGTATTGNARPWAEIQPAQCPATASK
jgi:hypothetical protein